MNKLKDLLIKLLEPLKKNPFLYFLVLVLLVFAGFGAFKLYVIEDVSRVKVESLK